MTLSALDIIIIVSFLFITLYISFLYKNEGSKDIASFFLGSRNLSWWVAGTSMVATTFAADTPLLIAEIVANHGISGNWIWWNGLIGGMLSVFFFAKYWRRAGVITDIEIIEKRYSGNAARWLRGFKAIYLGIFLNSVVIAWVNVAMASLLIVFFNLSYWEALWAVGGLMLFVVIYSSLSGLLGVAITDFFQFWIAMLGCVILAVLVVQSEAIGGIAGLKSKIPAESFSFLPAFSWSAEGLAQQGKTFVLGGATFLAYVGFQWWASWYPGMEPGGGGYVAQRMMSAKNEKHALWATLFFQIAHFAIRPLPWIVVGLCAIYLYPDLSAQDKKLGYVMAMRDFLPDGLRGLLLVAFLAAYMSTISTQINWGTSYLVNDFYALLNPEKANNPTQMVMASRWANFILMVVAFAVTTQISTLEGAFQFMIEAGAGLGAVLILRWYWWRINAWSEITATIAPFIPYAFAKFYWQMPFPDSFFFTVAFTTVAWILVTLLTPPDDMTKLKQFCENIRPQGYWQPIYKALQIDPPKSSIRYLLVLWLSGVVYIYALLFSLGELLFMEYQKAGIWAIIGIVSFVLYKYTEQNSKEI
ncbi:MAG: sodium:proline symporter [Cytophagales bacterium]|nr:MAG: sodium:proline symporter [Cytophagales bacterium]